MSKKDQKKRNIDTSDNKEKQTRKKDYKDETVNMLLVDKFLSKGIWSTDYCRKIFVDTTLRRHSTSSTSILSTQTYRSRRVVKSFKLLQILNYSAFKSWE
jgi:hypothetical protein